MDKHFGHRETQDSAVDRAEAAQVPILQGRGQEAVDLREARERLRDKFLGEGRRLALDRPHRFVLLRHGGEHAAHFAGVKLLHGLDAGLAAVFLGHGGGFQRGAFFF